MTLEELQAENDRLKAKNAELLGEVKDAKTGLRDIQTQLDALKTLDIEGLKAKAEELETLKGKKAEEEGDYKKLLETTRAQHQQQLDTLNKDASNWRAMFERTARDNALATALASSGVEAALIDPAIKLLRDDVTVVVEGDKINVSVGDKPVTEHVKTWLDTDVGRYFVPAKNGGAGLTGGGKGDQGASRFFDKKSPAYSLTEQAKVARENPQLAQQLREQFSGQ